MICKQIISSNRSTYYWDPEITIEYCGIIYPDNGSDNNDGISLTAQINGINDQC